MDVVKNVPWMLWTSQCEEWTWKGCPRLNLRWILWTWDHSAQPQKDAQIKIKFHTKIQEMTRFTTSRTLNLTQYFIPPLSLSLFYKSCFWRHPLLRVIMTLYIHFKQVVFLFGRLQGYDLFMRDFELHIFEFLLQDKNQGRGQKVDIDRCGRFVEYRLCLNWVCTTLM